MLFQVLNNNFSYTQVVSAFVLQEDFGIFLGPFSPFSFFLFREILIFFACFFSESFFVLLITFIWHFSYLNSFIRIFFIRILSIRTLFVENFRINRRNFYVISNILRRLFFLQQYIYILLKTLEDNNFYLF